MFALYRVATERLNDIKKNNFLQTNTCFFNFSFFKPLVFQWSSHRKYSLLPNLSLLNVQQNVRADFDDDRFGYNFNFLVTIFFDFTFYRL